VQRSDLASRIIKLQILPLPIRRTEAELEDEFGRVWPGVLGALLDGLVRALAGSQIIKVEEPARLIDFEKFAEAGCRAMGFGEWEFVDAYAANRRGSMVTAAEAHPVGRAIIAFLKAKPSGKKRFAGQMAVLYQKLEPYKDNAGRSWPKDPTRLSSDLTRVTKPLAACGITCLTGVDRRFEGGTQRDVVIEYAEGFE
jgi:hypothetical protein